MPLVEVVPHPGTNDTSINTALQFYNSLGRKAIHIRQETPGFVANRLQAAFCNEAYSLVARGIVTAQELGKEAPISYIVWCCTDINQCSQTLV
jgi:3-hydroxyacyl-CoA dehydrogenase